MAPTPSKQNQNLSEADKAAIKEKLIRGDVTFIANLSFQRGLNGGCGYSFDYAKKVLSDGNRNNEELWLLANELVESRLSLETHKK